MATTIVFQDSPKGPRADAIQKMIDEREASQAARQGSEEAAQQSASSASASAQSAVQSAGSAAGAASSANLSSQHANRSAQEADQAAVERAAAAAQAISALGHSNAAAASAAAAQLDRLAAQYASLVLGATHYPVAADLPVPGAMNAMGYVYNDADGSKNGLWFWNGTEWVFDRNNVMVQELVAAETSRATASEAALALRQDQFDSQLYVARSLSLLMAILDDDGFPTDIEIRRADGQISDRVMEKWALRVAARLGISLSTSGQSIFALLDSDGYPTDLEIRKSDGQISDRVMGKWIARIGAATGVTSASNHDILMAILDEANYPTDIEIRRADGQISDRVISKWAGRIAGHLGINLTSNAEALFALLDSDGYPTDLEIRKSDGRLSDRVVADIADRSRSFFSADPTDMTQIAAWGSSSIDLLNGHLNAMAVELGAVYRHGGDSGARSDMILARMGVEPYRARFPGGIIPASGPVNISVSYGIPHEYSNPMECWVEGTGVRGTLTSTAAGVWTFTRAGGSSLPVTVSGSVRLLPVAESGWRRAVQIVNIAKNDALFGNDGWQQRMIRSNALVLERHPSIDRRVICMGHYTARDDVTHAPIAAGISAANDALRARFGDQFFDLRAYLNGSQVWIDTEISPTSDDLTAQAAGRLAPSLALDNIHLLDSVNWAVADRLKSHMQTLGWF